MLRLCASIAGHACLMPGQGSSSCHEPKEKKILYIYKTYVNKKDLQESNFQKDKQVWRI